MIQTYTRENCSKDEAKEQARNLFYEKDNMILSVVLFRDKHCEITVDTDGNTPLSRRSGIPEIAFA